MTLNFEFNYIELENIKIPFNEIINVGRIDVALGDYRCKFIYCENESDIMFIFMYSDAVAYNNLLKAIAGNKDGTKNNLIKYQKYFGAEHAIWKQLLNQTCEIFDVDPCSYASSIFDDQFLSSHSDYINFCYHHDEREYPRKIEDLEEAYSELISILPQNLSKTRKTHEINFINGILYYYTNICGGNLEDEDKYFEYLHNFYENDATKWNTEKKNLLSAKSTICNALKDKIVSYSYISALDNFLDKSIQNISVKIKKIYEDDLTAAYGPIADIKHRLRSNIDRFDFNELLESFKKYKNTEKILRSNARLCETSEDESPYCDYINAFHYGSILLSDKMNLLNRNKAKKKYIPQDMLDKALIFYYDADSAEDACKKRSNEKYSHDKESGNIGERKVEYALRWLNKAYIKIQKKSKDRVGNDCILIQNKSYIDEKQEYDHIIISSKGIFNIETKNYSGKIVIDKQGNWIRKQDEREEGIKNPIQQIRQHEKMLASFLPNGCKIISVLCIANDRSIIEGTDNFAIPIVKSDMLVEFIEKYDSNNAYTSDQMQMFEKLIYDHMI